MAEDARGIRNIFQGLPMGELIGGPLIAARDAQAAAAKAQAEFAKAAQPAPPAEDEPDKDADA